jgi:hypothetical protein
MAGMASPAMAQGADGSRVNMIIVFGDDKCPDTSDKEIVVCARKDEGERYRIPAALRDRQARRMNPGPSG